MYKETKRILHEIKNDLAELDSEQYAEIMRELSFWLEQEANKVEYTPEFKDDDEL